MHQVHQKQLIMLIETGEANKLTDLLEKNNLDLEQRDPDGNTPLNIAAQNGNDEVVLSLIKQGASIDTQNDLGNTPLHFAITYNFPNVFKLLINSGKLGLLDMVIDTEIDVLDFRFW